MKKILKIKIPKEIKILTHTYKIKFDAKELVSSGTGGLTRHLYQQIILDNKAYPPSELNQIFLHEVMHLIERHFCVRLEDVDTDRISEGLAEFLFNNLGIEFDWSNIKGEE